MKLLKRIFRIEKEAPLFNKNGDANLIGDNAIFLDACLIVLSQEKHPMSIHSLQYYLLQCGFFVTIPELKEELTYFEKKGFIAEAPIMYQ